jgi:hypothetical protein
LGECCSVASASQCPLTSKHHHYPKQSQKKALPAQRALALLEQLAPPAPRAPWARQVCGGAGDAVLNGLNLGRGGRAALCAVLIALSAARLPTRPSSPPIFFFTPTKKSPSPTKQPKNIIKGPAGPTGAGATGAAGPTGATGSVGPTGVRRISERRLLLFVNCDLLNAAIAPSPPPSPFSPSPPPTKHTTNQKKVPPARRALALRELRAPREPPARRAPRARRPSRT